MFQFNYCAIKSIYQQGAVQINVPCFNSTIVRLKVGKFSDHDFVFLVSIQLLCD